MSDTRVPVAQLLDEGRARLAGGESPRADAEILLGHLLGRSRTWLLTWPEARVEDDIQRAYRQLIERRHAGEPVAHLVGHRAFWGFELHVTPAVLIPRPDTEILVERALEFLPAGPCRVADLGTGSGAVALALAQARSDIDVLATDISADALTVARGNAVRLGLAGRVRFVQGAWCAALGEALFQLIVSNPPYIPAGDPHLAQGDLRFEPPGALVSGEDGLQDIRALIACVPAHLHPEGRFLFEHGYDQGEKARKLLEDAGYLDVQTFDDLGGRARVSGGCRPR